MLGIILGIALMGTAAHYVAQPVAGAHSCESYEIPVERAEAIGGKAADLAAEKCAYRKGGAHLQVIAAGATETDAGRVQTFKVCSLDREDGRFDTGPKRQKIN